jgi:hypothetical protein
MVWSMQVPALLTTASGKKLFVRYYGKRVELKGQIHTHFGDRDFSDGDLKVMKILQGKPVYAFGQKNLYKGFHKTKEIYNILPYGNASRLRNGKIKLL